MYQWCEFKSHRGKNKNLTAQKSNSNTVWFNFQTYIYIGIVAQSSKLLYIYIYIYIYTSENIYIYTSLRSASGHRSVSIPQINVHWRRYLKSRSDLRIFSNQRPFQIMRSMADLLIRVRVMAYVSGRRFEKVRNGQRFENWKPIWEYEKGHRFENLKKGHSSILRYRCMWRRNRTWIWGLDVD